MIVLRVHEARRRCSTQLDGFASGEIVRLILEALPVDELLAIGRDAEDLATKQLTLFDQRALAGHGVDTIDVGARRLVIRREGAGVAADCPDAVAADVEIPHRRIGELDELPASDVERLAEGEVALLVSAGHLL